MAVQRRPSITPADESSSPKTSAGVATSISGLPSTLSPFSHDELAERLEGHKGRKLRESFGASIQTLGESSGANNVSEVEAPDIVQDPEIQQQFNPLFIVIEDPVTGEHHHPYIHYIFSDDSDSEMLTNALLHNLDPQLALEAPDDDQNNGSRTSDYQTNSDRVLIIDLDENGRNVVSAQSLSSDYQIIDTQISVAPTFNNGSAPEEAGLMLRISGVESRPAKNEATPEELFNQAHSLTGKDVTGALADLAEMFQQELSIVQKMLETDKASVGVDKFGTG